MTKVPKIVKDKLNKKEQPDRSGILRAAPVITDEDLRKDLKKYDKDKLRKVKNPLSLMGADGDTDYFDDHSEYVYIATGKNGKEYTHIVTGDEINYIGVGAGFKKFKFPRCSPMILPDLWNLGYGHFATQGELYFANWGYNNYKER